MLTIEHQGFRAKIKRADRLSDDGRVHGLPLGRDIEVYPVDEFKHPLPSWMTGAGNYVVPVQPNWGLWFDWTSNDDYNTAIMPTVKGMNPITGQKTQGYGLEQYQENCPVHGTQFKEGRFCEECNYKWPPQNYVCRPNRLWWDGFRAGDGTVRQFFFTEDMLKSIPERVLGAKETVPAFGFCFYKSKTHRARPIPTVNTFTSGWGSPFGATNPNYGQLATYLTTKGFQEPDVEEGCCRPIFQAGLSPTAKSFSWTSNEVTRGGMDAKLASTTSSLEHLLTALQRASLSAQCTPISDCVEPQEVKCSGALRAANVEVGVGAGAKINQGLVKDPWSLTDWSEEPTSIMRLYFVFEDQYKEVRSRGMRDLTGDKEGFLSGLPVG